MREPTWFGFVIVLVAAAALSNFAFGLDRMILVGGLSAMSLSAVISLRGEVTRVGRTMLVSLAMALVFAFAMSVYLSIADEGTRRKLSFHEVFILLAAVFGSCSVAIAGVASLLAVTAGRSRWKHVALSASLLIFLVSVSVALELQERHRQQFPGEPPTAQMVDPPVQD